MDECGLPRHFEGRWVYCAHLQKQCHRISRSMGKRMDSKLSTSVLTRNLAWHGSQHRRYHG
eukprot:6272980-Amphidinium_carterae.2